MTSLALEAVSYRYGARPVLHEVTARVEHPQIVALIGPNGAGKSTLVNVIAGRLRDYEGGCVMNGAEVKSLSRMQLARQAAHVPQQRIDDIPFTVEDVVLTGRAPHTRGLFESEEDLRALEAALELTQLTDFRKRLFARLSGGEQQRVLLAAAVAQQSEMLLLDEPGAHLDPHHETALWDLLARLRDQGKLILIVTHHLHLVARRADRVWLMNQGRLIADAPPAEAMQPERMESVFRVPFERWTDDRGRVFLNYG